MTSELSPDASTATDAALKQKTVGLAALLMLVAAMLYGPIVGNGFVWDDDLLISKNESIRSFNIGKALSAPLWNTDTIADQQVGYYRPVVTVGFMALWKIGGGRPAAFHVASLSLFVALTGLVFLFLKQRTGNDTAALWGSAVGAFFFLAHPTRVEPVAWVSGAFDLVMTVSVVGALVLLAIRGRVAMAAACVAIAVGCLSKETAVVIPAVIWLDQRWLLRRESRQALRVALVSFAVVLGVIVLRKLLGVDARTLWDIQTPLIAISRTVLVVSLYVLMAIAPSEYRARITWWTEQMPTVESRVIALCAAGLLIGWLVWLARRPTTRPQALFGLASVGTFFIFLAPALAVAHVVVEVKAAERYLLAPSVGLSAGLAALVAVLIRRATALSRAGVLALVSVCCVNAATAVKNTRYYTSEISLWSYHVSKNPADIVGWENLIAALNAERFWALSRRVSEYLLGQPTDNASRVSMMAHWLHSSAHDNAQTQEAVAPQAVRFAETVFSAPFGSELNVNVGGHEVRATLSSDAKRTLMTRPTLGDVTFRSAQLLAEAGKVELADQLVERRVTDQSDDYFSWMNAAIWQLGRFRFDKAEALAKEVVARFPGDRANDFFRRITKTLTALRAAHEVVGNEPAVARILACEVPLGPVARAHLAARLARAEVSWEDVEAVVQVEICDQRLKSARAYLERFRPRFRDRAEFNESVEEIDGKIKVVDELESFTENEIGEYVSFFRTP